MRNLTAGNKMNFTVFTFIVIIILIILICAIVMVLRHEKEEYQVTAGAFIYDSEYNYIDLKNNGTISKKWTGNYYLKEELTNENYKLGNYAVSYETNKRSLDLFGNFYQVLKGGDISKISGYNTINSSLEDKFYKIDDRKYLIVAKDIKNDTGSLSTGNYLIIIMDKLGNALLLNNEINAKTINEMIISTDDFDFDVANEKLIFGKDEIDLKKIIGSTNEYVYIEENDDKEEDQEENNAIIIAGSGNGGGTTTTITNNNNNNSSSTTVIQNGQNNSNVNNNGNNNNSNNNPNQDKTWVDSLNGWIGSVSDAFESIYNKENGDKNNTEDDSTITKSISLSSVNAGTTHIDINYTINDPENKYNVVYAIVSDGTNSTNIALNKTESTYRLTGLNPDTSYSVQIGHKIIYSDATSKDTIEDTMVTKTLCPSESLKVTKVSLDKIYYTLKIDSSFVYDEGAKIKFYINDEIDESLTITLTKEQLGTAASTGYSSSIKIPTNFTLGSSLSIQLEDTKYNNKSVYTNVKAKIINY